MKAVRNKKLWILAGLSLLFYACMPISITFGPSATPRVITATAPAVIPSDTPQPPSPTATSAPIHTQPSSSGGLDHVNIYLVAIGDNGALGKAIGCGDSLIAVEVPITPTPGVLRSALNELFDLEGEQYYGESGLYNALYQSRLRIDDLAVVNGEAVIKLKGDLVMGGECDIPRVEEQLKAAALQFSTVNRVSIFINGRPLEDVLDLRGQAYSSVILRWIAEGKAL